MSVESASNIDPWDFADDKNYTNAESFTIAEYEWKDNGESIQKKSLQCGIIIYENARCSLNTEQRLFRLAYMPFTLFGELFFLGLATLTNCLHMIWIKAHICSTRGRWVLDKRNVFKVYWRNMKLHMPVIINAYCCPIPFTILTVKWQFAHDTFKHSFNISVIILVQILRKFVNKGTLGNKSILVYAMIWHRPAIYIKTYFISIHDAIIEFAVSPSTIRFCQ